MDTTGMPVTYEAPSAVTVPMLSGRRSLEALHEQITSARYAMEVCCGLASELEVFPEFTWLPGNQALHTRGLLPLSYHITGAMGALHMLWHGLNRQSIWVLLVSCLTNAERVARDAVRHVSQLRDAAGGTAAAEQAQAIERWFTTIPEQCHQALAIVAGICADDYAGLQDAAREFNQRATEARREWMRAGEAARDELLPAPAPGY